MIDARDFDAAARALEREGFNAAAGRTTAWAIKRASNVVRKHVRDKARPHRKTGRMAGKVRTWPTGRGLDFAVRVRAGGRVAHLIAGGTAPHDLAPVRAHALAMTGSGGVVSFAASAHHPGTRADPFFAQGVAAAMPEIQQIVSEAAATMARELAYRIQRRR